MVRLAISRGVLYPTTLPCFHREPVARDLAAFVRWFWIPEWHLEPGHTSRQHVIGYLACNLVVGDSATEISGPTTRASYRDLTGKGWAVGALLRPAAVPALASDVASMRDGSRLVEAADLTDAVRAAMGSKGSGSARRQSAVAAFTAWLRTRLGNPSAEALLANRMVDAAETNPALRSVTDLASHLHVSTRTVQRLSAKYVGVGPALLIRRRRLQEAAEKLRENPTLDLTELAHEAGYADHAHLTRDFRSTLGFTPSSYRASLAESRPQRTV
ncbi:helix-turn-helix transcriptional regulator [Auritidibacter sp. NML100628]|uniref:helix-turn-helix transcriptional regulator n=1 Tax=Auritidibacter sp. NML100628 TaxID=2170742 RepID=UPI000D730679|nr:helix-turn-helix transcriptional regulator [Auritidibacter sp. NML100628]PXA77055.1 DNA-binding protein [Auritidibacter sp. NML100628]